MPRFAIGFYEALRGGDDARVLALLEEFVIPYCDIRNRAPGYAVSIIKAGLKVVGRPAGPVRAPLTDLDEAELAELTALVDKVR
ncbi:MAG TPA: dihydrodipicolinate synthase family protein [Streptosporangiaceae bacterium]